VYNWALETKTKAYYQDEESLSFTDLSSRLTSKKKEEETEWLSEVSAVTLQRSLHNLNQAFANFFGGPSRVPFLQFEEGRSDRSVRRHRLRPPRRHEQQLQWKAEAPSLEDAGTHPRSVVEGASVRAE
jgi:putative transposase